MVFVCNFIPRDKISVCSTMSLIFSCGCECSPHVVSVAFAYLCRVFAYVLCPYVSSLSGLSVSCLYGGNVIPVQLYSLPPEAIFILMSKLVGCYQLWCLPGALWSICGSVSTLGDICVSSLFVCALGSWPCAPVLSSSIKCFSLT